MRDWSSGEAEENRRGKRRAPASLLHSLCARTPRMSRNKKGGKNSPAVKRAEEPVKEKIALTPWTGTGVRPPTCPRPLRFGEFSPFRNS